MLRNTGGLETFGRCGGTVPPSRDASADTRETGREESLSGNVLYMRSRVETGVCMVTARESSMAGEQVFERGVTLFEDQYWEEEQS